ncbi:MAG: MFS transporter, partial [Rhodospirillaceae bacterium]|nr:MFS transporter [Rhodospirillaceae bacterium]
MDNGRIQFAFLNVGHFLDHFFMLIFATAAALTLTAEWQLSYAALIPYATPGFLAFGLFAIPAGWLADRWSRDAMMVIFFVGIGASSVLCGMADSPLQIAVGLTLIGLFAAVYHPVGLALVVQGRTQTGVPLAINGVFGNMGVASAALLTGFLIDTWGWRSAFVVPGIAAVVIGALYQLFISTARQTDGGGVVRAASADSARSPALPRRTLLRVFAVILFTTVTGSMIFQSTTFTLPEVFDERLADLAGTATLVGWYAFVVFSLAALAQLVVGYLVDHYSVCACRPAAGHVFRRHDDADRNRRAVRRDSLHAGRLRSDPDQRCAGWAHSAQRMAQSRLCAALRCGVQRHGSDPAADC